MISAMYRNGEKTARRFLELYVYPLKSRPGTSRIVNFLASLYPFKYLSPNFLVRDCSDEFYETIFDEIHDRHAIS